VRTIEPHTESDPVALLTQFILMFGSAIGHAPHYWVESTRHAPNEFAVLVGASSKARKGTAKDHLERLFRDALPEWVDQCIKSSLATGGCRGQRRASCDWSLCMRCLTRKLR
jgi:hypothetical protein